MHALKIMIDLLQALLNTAEPFKRHSQTDKMSLENSVIQIRFNN